MGSFAQTNKCSKIVEKAPTKMADENEIRLRLADARAGEISMCSTALPLFLFFLSVTTWYHIFRTLRFSNVRLTIK